MTNEAPKEKRMPGLMLRLPPEDMKALRAAAKKLNEESAQRPLREAARALIRYAERHSKFPDEMEIAPRDPAEREGAKVEEVVRAWAESPVVGYFEKLHNVHK